MRRWSALAVFLLAIGLGACHGGQRPPCPAGKNCVLIGNGAGPEWRRIGKAVK